MRLRYRTSNPTSIWYDEAQVPLPRDLKGAKLALIKRCRDFLGPQFYRCESIVISLMRKTQSKVDIKIDPSQFIPKRIKEKRIKSKPKAA